MKPNNKALQTIAVFLTILLLFQSCVVYHKAPTTLEHASQIKAKTKITTLTGETANYKYITLQDRQFYGVKLKSREWIKIPLDPKEIRQVLTQNKSASTWATIAIIVVPILAIAIAGGLAMEDAFDFNFPEENSNH
jgi:hypothetical protein